MTRKDFIALAADLRVDRISAERRGEATHLNSTFGEVYTSIVAALARANPRFDRDRFREAVYG